MLDPKEKVYTNVIIYKYAIIQKAYMHHNRKKKEKKEKNQTLAGN